MKIRAKHPKTEKVVKLDYVSIAQARYFNRDLVNFEIIL